MYADEGDEVSVFHQVSIERSIVDPTT
uniref:Uncharacterized protein n=1 Tax=Arundo donax TaxID=35708 RepID=A0A0A9CA19_ARUDO